MILNLLILLSAQSLWAGSHGLDSHLGTYFGSYFQRGDNLGGESIQFWLSLPPQGRVLLLHPSFGVCRGFDYGLTAQRGSIVIETEVTCDYLSPESAYSVGVELKVLQGPEAQSPRYVEGVQGEITFRLPDGEQIRANSSRNQLSLIKRGTWN